MTYNKMPWRQDSRSYRKKLHYVPIATDNRLSIILSCAICLIVGAHYKCLLSLTLT